MSEQRAPAPDRPGCLGLLARLFESQADNRPALPGVEAFELRRSLNTPGGQAFFAVLDEVVPDDYVILPEVSMASLFNVTSGPGRKSAFNRIAQKRIDYVLCEETNMRPACAIELDDSSHRRADRQERDAFVEEMFRNAELPLLRFKWRSSYDSEEIRSRIEAALED